MLIQVVLIVFFLSAMYKVFGRYRARDISLPLLVLWEIFWLIAILVTIRPNSSAWLAERLGVGRGADLVVYAALCLLFYVNFRLSVKIERLNKNITTLVRALALSEQQPKK